MVPFWKDLHSCQNSQLQGGWHEYSSVLPMGVGVLQCYCLHGFSTNIQCRCTSTLEEGGDTTAGECGDDVQVKIEGSML